MLRRWLDTPIIMTKSVKSFEKKDLICTSSQHLVKIVNKHLGKKKNRHIDIFCDFVQGGRTRSVQTFDYQTLGILNLKYCPQDIGCCFEITVAAMLPSRLSFHGLYQNPSIFSCEFGCRSTLPLRTWWMLPDFRSIRCLRVWGMLQPFWWRVNSWQFLGKAPANMAMHQVVHSLQQTLATIYDDHTLHGGLGMF